MLAWRFAVHLNRSLVELVGLVIEKTEVAHLKSFPCIVVKKTFQVTCGVASFQIHQMKLILSCRMPASSMILQFAQSKMLGGVVVPVLDVECLKRCPAILKGRVESIPKADRGIGKRVSQIVLKMFGKFIQPGSGK